MVYEPISAAFEGATLYYVLDGVRHILLGCRGNVTMEFNASRVTAYLDANGRIERVSCG